MVGSCGDRDGVRSFFVFRCSGYNGKWLQEEKLAPVDTENDFGEQVEVKGNLVVVGNGYVTES